MTYFVFLESDILTVPHMEPLASASPEDAMAEAAKLMVLHASVSRAHVFSGDDRVGTVHRP